MYLGTAIHYNTHHAKQISQKPNKSICKQNKNQQKFTEQKYRRSFANKKSLTSANEVQINFSAKLRRRFKQPFLPANASFTVNG